MEIIASVRALTPLAKSLTARRPGILAGLTLWSRQSFHHCGSVKTHDGYMEAIVVGDGQPTFRLWTSLVKRTSVSDVLHQFSASSDGKDLWFRSSAGCFVDGQARSFSGCQRRHLVRVRRACMDRSAYKRQYRLFLCSGNILGRSRSNPSDPHSGARDCGLSRRNSLHGGGPSTNLQGVHFAIAIAEDYFSLMDSLCLFSTSYLLFFAYHRKALFKISRFASTAPSSRWAAL